VIDAFASERQYVDHLAPIWKALGSQGTFWAPEHLRSHAESRGVTLTSSPSPGGSGPIMVAGYRDEKLTGNRPVVFVEHGAGQDYGGRHPSYPGGSRRERVVLFICPSDRVAEMNRAVYPGARFAVVGCPKLDSLHRDPPEPGEELAVGFHWDALVCPEARWALPHYLRALRGLGERYRLLGHAHPRAWGRLERVYRRLGIEPVKDFEEICRRARLYLFDNSSTGYEFASLDRPVVVLNAPWYRREIEHGLRFWELVDLGPQVDSPEELDSAIAHAGDEGYAERRREIVAEVYAHTDGKAAQRAAEAIGEVL